jgi:hypothetical protein
MWMPADPQQDGTWDPLRVIRAANALRDLGPERSRAVIDEYYRLVSRLDWDADTWLCTLCETLYNIPNYKEKSSVLSDVPFFEGRARYSNIPNRAESPNTLKPHRLRPPDDPFKVVDCRNRDTLAQTLRLLRSVYTPKSRYVDEFDVEACHREFLALKCRWDDAKQMYVRGDGSNVSLLPKLYPRRSWTSRHLAPDTVTVRCARLDDEEAWYEISLQPNHKDGIFRILDVKTGKELTQQGICPAHAGAGSNFKLGPTQKVRFEVTINGQRTLSDVISLDQ